MNKISSTITEIKIETLVPFSLCASQTYEGARLEQLMSSIKRVGLMSPVIVRPVDDETYEIICGHNRAKAARALGYDVIRADVRSGLSDDEALELFFDSNLNQQSFSDWNYSQKLDAIKYIEKLIKENSHQGKRTDLEVKQLKGVKASTSVQSRQKLGGVPKRSTSRDRMARRLGISTATLSKYRRIIKLSDDQVKSLAQLLDEKRITFEAAYIISNWKSRDISFLIRAINKYSDKKLDLDKLKKLSSGNINNSTTSPISKVQILEALVPVKPFL